MVFPNCGPTLPLGTMTIVDLFQHYVRKLVCKFELYRPSGSKNFFFFYKKVFSSINLRDVFFSHTYRCKTMISSARHPCEIFLSCTATTSFDCDSYRSKLLQIVSFKNSILYILWRLTMLF
jgi:hypothetical protein